MLIRLQQTFVTPLRWTCLYNVNSCKKVVLKIQVFQLSKNGRDTRLSKLEEIPVYQILSIILWKCEIININCIVKIQFIWNVSFKWNKATRLKKWPTLKSFKSTWIYSNSIWLYEGSNQHINIIIFSQRQKMWVWHYITWNLTEVWLERFFKEYCRCSSHGKGWL